MRKPRALDLFCKAGGAARGLAAAGFDVTGIDIEPQPNYPYAFHQMDALSGDGHPDWIGYLRSFDFIWASPPCLANTPLRHAPNAKKHKDLIPETRAMLRKAGVMYVIENVPGAPLENPITLCGSMFHLNVNINGKRFDLRRHRKFETSENFTLGQPLCYHTAHAVIGIYGGHVRCRAKRHGGRGTREIWYGYYDIGSLAAEALGLPHGCMTMDEYSNAIPPAYAEWIARAAKAHIINRDGEWIKR